MARDVRLRLPGTIHMLEYFSCTRGYDGPSQCFGSAKCASPETRLRFEPVASWHLVALPFHGLLHCSIAIPSAPLLNSRYRRAASALVSDSPFLNEKTFTGHECKLILGVDLELSRRSLHGTNLTYTFQALYGCMLARANQPATLLTRDDVFA